MSEQAPQARSSGRPRVAIVFGGRSSEHAVSCSTAASVLSAIDRDAWDVVPVGIARDGRWVLVADDPEPLRLLPGQQPEVDGNGTGVLVPLGSDQRGLTVLEPGRPPRELGEVDVVFPLLHGPFGEDGTIQGMFELADVRYVGSGVAASATMMDKALMKTLFVAASLPVCPFEVITDLDWQRDPGAALERAAALGFPSFVKPARAGSSMGIGKVTSSVGLREAVEAARLHDPKVLVEAAVVGREVECGVLQGRGTTPPRTSVVGEAVVVKGHEFYDYEAKYLATDDVRLDCPADLPPDVSDRLRALAARAFDVGGCEGLARVDCFYTDAGELVLNEVNTMPGFTPSSMFPLVWQATGVGYAELIDELLTLALERRTGLR